MVEKRKTKVTGGTPMCVCVCVYVYKRIITLLIEKPQDHFFLFKVVYMEMAGITRNVVESG